MSDAFKSLIGAAADGPLTWTQAREAFEIIMTGQATPAQVGGFLMALRARGETVDELTAAATVMREKVLAVRAPAGAMDIVGTGGDGRGTLNISTASAFVVAGAGVVVAKHGNRALSSKSGAADALAATGAKVMVAAPVVERCLAQAGIGFMMAPMHHPAMKHVGPVRVELGTRTLFNLLGPLTNPAGVTRQLTGAFHPRWLRPMAETLRALGSEAAWLVHGSDGTDELTICGPSQVVALKNGQITEMTVTPADAGLPTHDFSAIAGGTPEENAKAFRDVLRGAPGGYRDAVLLNSAAALLIAGHARDLVEGVRLAASSIDSGKAHDVLERYIAASNA